MSNTFYSGAPASTSQIPTYSGSSQSFAARARAKKAALEAQTRIPPPPGLAPPTISTTTNTRGRSREQSPSFYGVYDGRRSGSSRILLPVAPSVTPSTSIISPSTPSPDPRTPSPPPLLESSSLHQLSAPSSTSSRPNPNGIVSRPAPAPHTASSSTVNSSSSTATITEKRPSNVIRKKTNPQTVDSKIVMRTGSTTSTNASSASFTTSTSTSHMDRGYAPSVFGVSMPPTSYTYGSRPGRHNSRTVTPSPGVSGPISMQRTRSGSGSQSSVTSAQTPASGLDFQLNTIKAGTIPPPLTIPAAVAENYNSSPSTASPGMFSYNSTPTSSSTNPSLFQSPGFSPPVQKIRNSSPTRPLISKYAGVTAATNELGKAIAIKRKDGEGAATEIPKQVKVPSRNSLLPLNSSGISISNPKNRDLRSLEAPKPAQGSKHTRKSSRDLLPSKSALSVFHFRKSSKDLTTTSGSSSQIGRSSHSRQSSRDSSNIRSPGESSATSVSYFPSTSPIPIPIPSSSTNSLRFPPSRPSRDGAPDDLEGFGSEVPVIQSGIIASKDSKAKGQKMKIVTSSSLPRSGAHFGHVNGSTSSLNLTSTSVPGQSKSIRSPTPTSAKATSIVHGFASTQPSILSPQTSKAVDSSPRKLKKEDKKNTADKNPTTITPSTSRPSLFNRGRKTPPAHASTSGDKDKTAIPKRLPGPSAGTGHEGYSQFNKPTRNRSSSSGSIPTTSAKAQASGPTPPGSWGRSAGAAALKNASIDPYFASRLKPVVIKDGVVKPTGGTDMVKVSSAQSSQSVSSLPPRSTPKAESQSSSLDLSRTEAGQNSRDPSLDNPQRVPNEFDQFNFGPDVISQRRPSVTIDAASQTRPSGESPTTSALPSATFKLGIGKSSRLGSFGKTEEKESKLTPSRKLTPPVVGSTSQPGRRWFFLRSQSAPDVSKENSKVNSPLKPASQSPILKQEVKFGDDNAGGYILDVHSPPSKRPVQEIPRTALTQNQQQQRESVLLPEPPVKSRLVSPRTPSPVVNISFNSPSITSARTVSVTDSSGSRPIRLPPGLPIPAELNPTISVTSYTPAQPSSIIKPLEVQNASPVSALTTSPSSFITKSASPGNSSRPSPTNYPVRDILQEATDKAELNDGDDDYNESDEDGDEDTRSDNDDEMQETPSSTVPIVHSEPPVMSPPLTPKSTPEPTTRQRLGNFAVGRIPKTSNVEGPAIKLPTLAEILPPPPSLRSHQPTQQQPIKIHPPRRMAHPPMEQTHSASSEGEDDGGEGIDYINTRKIPLSKLAPLVTNGLSQFHITIPSQRTSDNTDDWAEYDDFIDEMSATTPRSNTPSHGTQFADFLRFKPDLRDDIEPTRRLKDSPTLPSAATFGVVTKFASSNKKKLVLDQGKLAQGRPVAARPFFSPTLPTARSSLFGGSLKELNSQRSSSTYSQRSSGNQKTIAFADFIAAYAEVDRGVMSVIDPLDKVKHASSQARKLGMLSPMSSVTDFEDDSSTDSESYRESIISAMPGTEDALEGEMKVRLWALMTSRWLSFGRVLVSPAHEEIKSAPPGTPNKRILVIDGLGNDDWSFYCSLNYSNATVYNLTPSQATYPQSPAGGRPNSGGSGDNLNNHHQIHHASFASPFPFPSGFFSVVTFRFLPCASDALWPFIISQCMRVLKPGGYLELSVLDIDMVNMGPRTKRTIDEIKINLREHQSGNGSDWHKKTPSEKALRLMAKRGFTDITRCRVGLPTVGNVDGSREEQASMQQILKEGNSPDEVDMGSAEGINRVVSKVGRWWYNKCFENIDEDAQGESLKYHQTLWEDKTLLRECEKKKTNFRMLISFARKPSNQ